MMINLILECPLCFEPYLFVGTISYYNEEIVWRDGAQTVFN